MIKRECVKIHKYDAYINMMYRLWHLNCDRKDRIKENCLQEETNFYHKM